MAKPTRVEIINLGNELLLGLRSNDHLTYLATKFAEKGLPVSRNVVIPDEAAYVEECIQQAWEKADIIITTGGLGPTDDDITRETVAKTLGLKLEKSAEVEAAIRARFARLNRTMTSNNLKQTYLLEGAEYLPNDSGSAPGQWLEKDGKLLIMLPGPKSELYPMFEEQIIPRLQFKGIFHEDSGYIQLRTFGIGESALEDKLRQVYDQYGKDLFVAYCPHSGLVDVRISRTLGSALTWHDIEDIAGECARILGDDFIGYGDISPANLILSQLRALNKSVACAESCTGGLLADAFTNVPGASKIFAGGVVCYNNDAKMTMLDVPEAILHQHGAVSAECAIAMATGAAERFGADYALSVTGFAGPGGGTAENPVGTIYIGFYSPAGVWSQKLIYPGNRMAVKRRAVNALLDFMRRKLRKYEVESVLMNINIPGQTP